MNNPKTLNEFLQSRPSHDPIHDHMANLIAMEIRLQDELTRDNVRAYLGIVTSARSYCEDVGYNKIHVVDRYFRSLANQCAMMNAALNKEKPQGTPSS